MQYFRSMTRKYSKADLLEMAEILRQHRDQLADEGIEIRTGKRIYEKKTLDVEVKQLADLIRLGDRLQITLREIVFQAFGAWIQQAKQRTSLNDENEHQA